MEYTLCESCYKRSDRPTRTEAELDQITCQVLQVLSLRAASPTEVDLDLEHQQAFRELEAARTIGID